MLALLFAAAAPTQDLGQREAPAAIWSAPRASLPEALAAREVQRYAYLRTGILLPLREAAELPESGDLVVLAAKERALARAAAAAAGAEGEIGALGPEEYRIRTVRQGGRTLLLICGGDGAGVLNGAYRYAEALGARFYLHGDVLPDKPAATALPELDLRGAPLFDVRGIQPFHDFPEGPDWWTADDHKAVIAQVRKMRMNFIGFHTYPETLGDGLRWESEPAVWIGPMEDLEAGGRARHAYPSIWFNTAHPHWGYAAGATSEFSCGAAELFPSDAFGPEVMEGLLPRPEAPEQCVELFRRTAALWRDVFGFARRLGVQTCLGTEAPLTVPREVAERLRAAGRDASDPEVVRDLYEGTFRRIAAAHSLDWYWLWTPESWTWSDIPAEQVRRVEDDLKLALDALRRSGAPFRLATCGWVLGPPADRAGFGRILPEDVALSCINRQVGHAPLDPAFAEVQGRPKWAIPWLENDPNLLCPQLWVGRMRADAAGARRYGCTGLLGIHWRTKTVGPSAAALAAAAWEQPWDAAGAPAEAPGALGGRVAVFARVRKNRALDLSFEGVVVADGILRLDFTREVEFPCIAALTIQGTTADGSSFTRRINCGGPAWGAYEADPFEDPAARSAPTADFWLDFARANFGGEVAAEAAAIFERMDGRLPAPSDWIEGPGGIRLNPAPWAQERQRYAFVNELEALRPRVRGAGSRERVSWWLQTFRYLRAVGHLGCELQSLERAVQAQDWDEALARRLAAAAVWTEAMEHLLATVDTPGELGTVANLELHNRRALALLHKHDAALEQALGRPLPQDAHPPRSWTGPPRVIVPTVRSHAEKGEPLRVRVLLPGFREGAAAAVLWRPLGRGEFQRLPLRRVSRAVHEAVLPAAAETFEYHVEATAPGGAALRWPATAPRLNQTVVVLPATGP